MDLADFEQRFFHRHAFHLYFWTFFVIFAVILNVSLNQWTSFLEDDCGFQEFNDNNFSRFTSVPTRANDVRDENGCWFYSDNVTDSSSSNETVDRAAFECIYYYSQHGILN